MNIGIKYIHKAHAWQVYQKTTDKKLNKNDMIVNKEEYFITKQEAQNRLKELKNEN